MAGTSTIGSLLGAYTSDLSDLLGTCAARLDAEALDEGLAAKMCMETARLVAYEQVRLLPLLRDLPDGASLVLVEEEHLDRLLAASRTLENTALDGPLREALHGLAVALDALSRHQGTHTFPQVDEALPAAEVEAQAEHLTPTMQPGATHSHPAALNRYAAAGWPRSGFTDAARDAFAEEAGAARLG